MACVNPDGTITSSAKAILVFLQIPMTAEEIAPRVRQPLFRVRASLREMAESGLLEDKDGVFSVSEKGKEHL